MNDAREMMADGTVTVTQAIAFSGLQRTTLYALMEQGERKPGPITLTLTMPRDWIKMEVAG